MNMTTNGITYVIVLKAYVKITNMRNIITNVMENTITNVIALKRFVKVMNVMLNNTNVIVTNVIPTILIKITNVMLATTFVMNSVIWLSWDKQKENYFAIENPVM